jgi:hypothetical protein
MFTFSLQEYTQNQTTGSQVEEVPPPSDAQTTDNDIDDLLPKEVMCEINVIRYWTNANIFVIEPGR